MLNHDMGHGGVYCDQAGVSGVSQFVQSPDGVIPSLVRLEASKYRNDFGRYVAAKLALDDCFFEFSFAVPDNEGCPSRPEAAAAAYPIWSSAERRLTKASMSLQSNGMGFVSLILWIS